MNADLNSVVTERAELEQHIIAIARGLRRDFETGCYDEDVLYQFVHSWNVLSMYYRNHGDETIAVELVGVYLDFLHEFRVVGSDAETQPNCRDRIHEAQVELETSMDDIIIAVRARQHDEN
ncbi:MAG TPA: hypothetical protein VMT34_14300 [Aggregatilineales bacterium]|nr:hypothetical protein [Aggregatilineales bacterium]